LRARTDQPDVEAAQASKYGRRHAHGRRSGEERQRVFEVGDGIADQPEGMQYFGKRKADESGPGGNDQAKSNRVGVDGAGPATG
jgi:hypothetical protein